MDTIGTNLSSRISALSSNAVKRLLAVLWPPAALSPHSNHLAGLAAVVACVVVALCGIADAIYGTNTADKATAVHYFAVAFQGVACSVLASATYCIFVENAHAIQRERVRRDFLSLFGLPEMSTSPRCFIVTPQTDQFSLPAEDYAGNKVSFRILLPLPMTWNADVGCAYGLHTMITAVLGAAPQWLTPENAQRIAQQAEEPTIFFSVGLWSNPFTLLLCEGGEHACQQLLRLPCEPVATVQVACPSPSGEYRVEGDHDDVQVSGGDKSGECILMRTRGPRAANTACVIVGGLTAEGTSRMGEYLQEHWRDILSLADTSLSARVIRGHQYLVWLKVFSNGAVATGQVRVGPSVAR